MKKSYKKIAKAIKAIFSNLKMSVRKNKISLEVLRVNNTEVLVPVKNIPQTFNELGTSFLNNKTFVF